MTISQDARGDAVISFRNVWKRYGEVIAAQALDLDVKTGEFLSLLGPSGCGKTTALRMIAGFDQPSEGEVLLHGERVNDLPAYRRPVNMVFQHYALFPHLNVQDNVAYGLRQRTPKIPKREIERRVGETLELVRLQGFDQRSIWEMSGGQQQRVALARALINQPKVLLLDEPLAALDRKLRRDMQIELQNLQRNTGITFILVTHDQEEALSMSDRVCIMRQGKIVQIGNARELYDHPCNRYVADFVGKSNFFAARIVDRDERAVSATLNDGSVIELPATSVANTPEAQVTVSVRPEQILLTRREATLPDNCAIKTEVRVLNRIFLGEHTEYLLHADRLGEFLALTPRQSELNEPPFDVDDTIFAGWRRDSALVLGDV